MSVTLNLLFNMLKIQPVLLKKSFSLSPLPFLWCRFYRYCVHCRNRKACWHRNQRDHWGEDLQVWRQQGLKHFSLSLFEDFQHVWWHRSMPRTVLRSGRYCLGVVSTLAPPLFVFSLNQSCTVWYLATGLKYVCQTSSLATCSFRQSSYGHVDSSDDPAVSVGTNFLRIHLYIFYF